MRKHILIIDDDPDTLEILKEILSDAEYSVTTFTETDNILATVAQYTPDLVIVDYLLQGINGGEICAQIKKNTPTQMIPVILMSAHARVMLSLGTYNCDEFIEKPFDMAHLTQRLQYHLKRSSPRNRHQRYTKVELVNSI